MNLEKNLTNSSHENKVEKIKIIKNLKINDDVLGDFYFYLKQKDINIVEETEKADLIISFGGDGTMLVAAKETIDNDIPIMAVNMGTLGYLAEINPNEAIEMLENYQIGNYTIDERNFLEVNYNNKKYYALNELLITKGGLMSKIIEVEVYSNDFFVNKYRADGIIISTPTGSTAYSLSAGGSIVHPGLNALIITPIAPQSLTARPIIIDGKERLRFKTFSRNDDIHLNIDGNICFRIGEKDIIETVLSNKTVKIIRTGKKDFYSILREKLKWGDSVIK